MLASTEKNTMKYKTLFILLTIFVTHVHYARAQHDLTTPDGGVITYCSSHGSYPGKYAFDDGGTGDGSRWLANGSALPNAWVQYVFPEAVTVSGYRVFGFASSNNGLARDPKAWYFEGSNDGISWTPLDTQINQTGWTSLQSRLFYFDNETAFTHYRFTITATNGANDYTGVQELEFYGNPNVPGVPLVTTEVGEGISTGKAALSATLVLGGPSDLIFHWGAQPGVWDDTTTLSNVMPGTHSTNISDLDIFRTYYWTVSAHNNHGDIWAPTTNSFVSATGSDITNPDGVITGCDSLSPYLPARAFDDNTTTEGGRWLAYATNMPNAWVQYEFTQGPYLLRAYSVRGLRSNSYAARSPKAWTLSGSTNGTDWVELDSQNSQTKWGEGEKRTFTLDPDASFTHFRFTISENNGDAAYTGVQELELFGFPDYVAHPEIISAGVEQTGGGTAMLKGSLLEGGPADIYVAWGENQTSLNQTNLMLSVFNGTFEFNIAGLIPFETYYYTFFAINSEGRAEIEDAPLSFVADGEHFTWIGTSGNWEDPAKWSQGTRYPDNPGDLVFINTIRTITLNEPSATIGGITLSGPYAQGHVVITNSNPDGQIVFDNPAGRAFINANVGGSAPYVIYPNLLLNEDVDVSGTESWQIYLRGGVSGQGRLVMQQGSHVRLAPLVDTVYENVFEAQSPTAYLHIAEPGRVIFKGTNTVSFHGNWSDNSCALKSNAELVLDGGVTTNISVSDRSLFTYHGITNASLSIINGASLINSSGGLTTYLSGIGNQFTIAGTGSTWAFSGRPIYETGTSNKLNVVDGGLIDRAYFSTRGNFAKIRIADGGTLWNVGGRFCIGRASSYNIAEITDGAVVSNCVVYVGGRTGYDDSNIGGGLNNSLLISNGAKLYSTLGDQLTDGGGVGVSGRDILPTYNNTLEVTDDESLLDLGNHNFNIGYMQKTDATGAWNRVTASSGGVITNAANLRIGRVSGSSQESWSNCLQAAKGGNISINNQITVGDERSTGNRISIAGGRISAKKLFIHHENGIAVELGTEVPVPAEFSETVTFETETLVWPSLQDGVKEGVGGTILTASEIIDGGLELAPEVDPALWKLVKTNTSIALYYHLPASIIVVR